MRAKAMQDGTAGAYAQSRASKMGWRPRLALGAAGAALVQLGYVIDRAPWGAALALVGLVAVTAAVAVTQPNSWEIGAQSERKVARELARLGEGWLIAHDILMPIGGNLDHLAAGPSGLWAIETKTSRFDTWDIAQTRRNAAWANKAFGEPTIAVLCIARSNMRPREYRGVWCVGATRLTRFMRKQPHTGLDLARVSRRLAYQRARAQQTQSKQVSGEQRRGRQWW